MTTHVDLPELGESVTEATVTTWLKQIGDVVEEGEPLLEVSTDKVDTELPSPVSGTLVSIEVQEDETVTVGATLATISTAAPAVSPEASAPAAAAAVPQPMTIHVEGELPISVLVSSVASARGVDVGDVKGSGLGGRVRAADIDMAIPTRDAVAPLPFVFELPALQALPTLVMLGDPREKVADSETALSQTAPVQAAPSIGASETGDATVEKLTRLRGVIARRMIDSLQTSAQLTSVVEIDVTAVDAVRRQHASAFLSRNGVKLSFTPFFAVAAIKALMAHPTLNASISPDLTSATYYKRVHLSMAVDTDRGLLAPVIRNADDLTIDALAREIATIAERTRDGSVTADELSGGTFTLTNTGSRGTLFDTPIINQPQVAILGTGAVVKRPVVITKPAYGDTIAVRSMVHFALTYDHRLVDGADAARYLATVKGLLEDLAFSRTIVGLAP